VSLFKKEEPRVWGRNKDGTPYAVGITVAQLIEKLQAFAPTDEVCMSVHTKRTENGGGFIGKVKSVDSGATGQIWLTGGVVDESLEH
jgi:hypothetical protein